MVAMSVRSRSVTESQLNKWSNKGLAICLTIFGMLVSRTCAGAQSSSTGDTNQFITNRTLPWRVHVYEDFETDIERRWWLRGAVETNNLPASLSSTLANTRACRAAATKDFDDKQGDPLKNFKAVVFNPVPGPPMG